MLILSSAETESLLDPDALRRALAVAMADLSAGRASMPPRIAAHVEERGGFVAAMPAYLPATRIVTAKLVSHFPGNAGTALPTHQAVVVVFDAANGRPVALLDGTSITTARTAAGSALATDLLARSGADVLAIVGTGVQARAHAHAVVRVRPFRELRIAGRDPGRAAALAAELRGALDVEIVAAAGVADACAGAAVRTRPQPRSFSRPHATPVSASSSTCSRRPRLAPVRTGPRPAKYPQRDSNPCYRRERPTS